MEHSDTSLNDSITLILSIDVEEDMPNWKAEERVTTRNISSIPRLQHFFDRYRITPTYLLTYPVASERESVSIFNAILQNSGCEIGSHLHPWTTPPVTLNERELLTVPSALDHKRLREKLINLTDKITHSFGISPTSYRAGRFGFDRRTALILSELGYVVDTSFTPLISWETISGPSFLYERVEPHFLKDKYGDDSLASFLEVPVSIALTRDLKGFWKRIYLNVPRFTKMRGLLSKDYLNLVDIIWLYPTFYTSQEMIRLSDILIERGNRVLNMFFHSSEIKAGESIYHKAESDIAFFFKKLESYFDYLFSKYHVNASTLTAYRNHLVGGKM